MIKGLSKILMTIGLVGLAGAASAMPITITPSDCDDFGGARDCWTTNDTSQPDSASLSALIGVAAEDLNELYKAEVGGDDGPNYNTVFSNTPTDPSDAMIVWLEGAYIDCSMGCYLTIKDGTHTPALYVYDISDWDGMSTIYLEDFWPQGGAISNVAIWGGDTPKVPEPGTLVLLGIGLFAIGLLRRRRSPVQP